jgi:hypothetical protein
MALRAQKLEVVEVEAAAVDERHNMIDFELAAPGVAVHDVVGMVSAVLTLVAIPRDEELAGRPRVVVGLPGQDAVGFAVAAVVPVAFAARGAEIDLLAAKPTTATLRIVVR